MIKLLSFLITISFSCMAYAQDIKPGALQLQEYLPALKNKNVMMPRVREHAFHTYHLYVIQCDGRDEMVNQLKKHKHEQVNRGSHC